MSIQAMANRSIKTIKTELEFLRESDLIDPTILSRIIALLPELETAKPTNKTSTSAPEVAKKWAPVQIASVAPGTAAVAAAKPPLPLRTKTSTSTVTTSPIPEKTAPAPALPPPPSYNTQNIYKALFDYYGDDPSDLPCKETDLIIALDATGDEWLYGRLMSNGKEGWVPKNRITPATAEDIANNEKKVKNPPHDINMMTNVAHGSAPNSGFSAPQPPQQQEEKGKDKLEENGKKFGSKLGNAAIFGAGATIGSKIVNGIF